LKLSNKAKIALILGCLLVLAIILVFYLNRKSKQASTAPDKSPVSSEDIYAPDTTAEATGGVSEPGVTPSPTSSDQIKYISPTASASASSTKVSARTPTSTVDESGIRTYEVTVTPAPNAGPYDWTSTTKTLTIKDISGSEIAEKTPCELAGLSNSWSNMFDKVSCDFINFFDGKIMTPLFDITCNLYATNIQYATGRKITYESKGGACLIIDRQ